ncbi:FtsQ-type POTRA domain-containing protein [Microbacterium luticocti]|uniref:FtsQ-type POTRA domain-containing protein n=1 Tax=Microbacterium luticocti TaxID=451764 RepID=UPI000418408E
MPTPEPETEQTAPLLPLRAAARDRRHPESDAPDTAPDATAPGAATDATTPGATAPDATTPGATAPDATAPGTATDATAPAPADDAVGMRDVWKAARARRRALRAEMRRFTARARRRRAVWIGIGVALVVLVAGTLAAAYSPLFAVQRVHVVGTHALDAAAVEKALADQVGTPLPLVDEAEIKAALVAFPLVQSYSLQARPPHELVVRIVERTPVGVVKGPAGYTLVDAAGVALATTATAPKGQPLIEVGPGVHSDAFRAAGQVMRSLPSGIRSQVTKVTATTPDDVTLALGKTRTTVVWGSADDSAYKALVLQTLMKKVPPAKVYSYDVSSPNAAVVR